MNELIKQFVIQAGFSETYGLKEKERLSKFAELIVWECAMIASTETSDDGVGEVVKEHFGIKE